ncbi:hypothetical protein [Actinacidiphila alni]|uniref:hypothetical protein n=1 Tax=Actinacidiphila alni TaxID=380248 RepID=UPI0034526987
MAAGDQLKGLTPLELIRVYRIAGMAGLRGDTLTTRQKQILDRIAARVAKRRDQAQ